MIPSVDEFVTKVGSGPNLNKVTNALTDYWDEVHRNGGLHPLILALRTLIARCKAWVKMKDAKSDFKRNKFGQKTGIVNTKFVNRREQVSKLAISATQALLTLLRSNFLLTPDARGQLNFDIRKYRQKALQRGARFQAKELAPGYQQERGTWLASKKTVAVSGSEMHSMFHPSRGYAENRFPRNANRKQKKAFDKLEKTHGAGGSINDWRILGQITALGNTSVIYLKKAQRYQYMRFIAGGLLIDVNDHHVDYGDLQVLWVMDRYSNLFTYDLPDLRGQVQGNPAVNHSSMNAGRAVLCAGMIMVQNGQVKLLTNSSGHYKPTKRDFSEAVAILTDEGLDFSEANNGDGDDTYNGSVVAIGGPAPPAPGQRNFVMWETFPVADFIRSHGACAPSRATPGPPP